MVRNILDKNAPIRVFDRRGLPCTLSTEKEDIGVWLTICFSIGSIGVILTELDAVGD